MKNIVLAIGNGGCNIADSIRKRCEKLGDAQYMFCDTDVEDLHRHGKAGDKFIALKSDETCLADVITADVNRSYSWWRNRQQICADRSGSD